MEKFVYKKAAGITALNASFSEFQYKKHCHEEYAIGVTLRGVQQYNMGGNLRSSYPGGVMLFHPEQVHDGMSQGKTGVDYQMVYIDKNLFSELTGKKEPVIFSSPILYNRKLKQNIQNLVNSVFHEEEDALCNELLVTLAESFSHPLKSGDSAGNHTLMNKAKEIIYYSLDSSHVLRLDDVCREIGMPKYQFIRAFRGITGISPYQFYINCKVEKAKQIIEESKDIYLAVTECGFVDLSHFNRHFKSRYGITAFQYMLEIG